MTVTKDSIVEVVVRGNWISEKQSLEIVETLIEIIKKTLESGDDVLVQWVRQVLCQSKEENGRDGIRLLVRI